jgi:hypothetical protein
VKKPMFPRFIPSFTSGVSVRGVRLGEGDAV